MSDDSVVDSSIDLKKRARRRLVGAAALALMAVIVLPIVMDSEPKPSGQEIQIRIPDKDGDSLSARVIPAHPAPLAQRKEITEPTPAMTSAETLAGEAVGKPAETAISATAPIVAKPKVEPQAAKTESAIKAEAAHAEAILEGKDSGLWVVQLGAYQSAVNVKQLTSKLKDMGLPVYTEKFDSPQGARTRVRAGPFKSREAADKARLRITKIGVDGPVAQK